MTINLIIEDIGVKDAGKGFARITSRKMTELGLQPLDVIEICGQRKSANRHNEGWLASKFRICKLPAFSSFTISKLS